MNVLIVLNLPDSQRLRYPDGLKRAFPDLNINLVNNHSLVDPYIADADVLITFGPHMADHVFEKGKNLKWVQALGTGVDGIADRQALRKDVIVTNMHGVHGDSMSESAILSMLALARDLPRNVRNQAKHEWGRWPSRLITGKTVGILGVGAIAEALAPRCKALGMTVVGVTSGKRTVPGFDRMESKDRLAQVVGEFDYFVLLTPYSKETHHLVNAAVLGAMKPRSFLVNLARGGVVDETALIEVLKNGPLAGAADRKSTRLNSSHIPLSRMPSSA